MKFEIFGESVQGASHIRTGTECQDSNKIVHLGADIHILAIADGHGSKSCPYSKTGSAIAVNVFCMVMERLCKSYADNMDAMFSYLNREGDTQVAQMIDSEWKRRVLKRHTDSKRTSELINGKKDKDKIIRQYGTTLVGLLLTPSYVFGFQLGDGCITCVNSKGVKEFVSTDKILGTETHSLSNKHSWEKAVSSVRKAEFQNNLPLLFMLSTDGFSNSFSSESEFRKACRGYFKNVKAYGCDAVSQHLKEWLADTSGMGCGDDITLLMAYVS